MVIFCKVFKQAICELAVGYHQLLVSYYLLLAVKIHRCEYKNLQSFEGGGGVKSEASCCVKHLVANKVASVHRFLVAC